jgi:hypothetical protein
MSGERLYNLLPAIYRIRDKDHGEPLRALMGIFEGELDRVESDISGLYENWFIETCQEWVVPYIGDLLGVQHLHRIGEDVSLRPYIANTLAYRRRKGTAPVLEQLARDVTGWPARAVEFFELLETTQHVNHRRLHSLRTPDLRDTNALELLGGPLEKAAHTADVRHIDNGRGKYNIMNMGLFLWRLQSYAIPRAQAGQIDLINRRYTFHPLGYDAPLFNRPQTETEITHLAEEINLPGMLRRRPLYDELEAWRKALVNGETPDSLYFGDAMPVLQIYLNGALTPVAPEEILICNLTNWHNPPDSKSYIASNGFVKQRTIKAAADPVLGRLTFPTIGDAPTLVEVSYAYGFSADVGGGPYNRKDVIASVLTREVTWQVGVSKSATATVNGESIFTTLSGAVNAWNSQPAGTVGVIAVMDNRTYQEELTGDRTIKVPAGSQLLIVAANWPEEEDPDVPEQMMRKVGRLNPDDLRPHLKGNIFVKGTANPDSTSPGELVLDGLLIEGGLGIKKGNLGKLRISHCTLVPDQGGVTMQSAPNTNDQLQVTLYRSICGPIALLDTVEALSVEESIIDQSRATVISAPGVAVAIIGSTLFGKVSVKSLEASNSIFTDMIEVKRRQTGCIRFCYIPKGSETPRRYQCQPDLALEGIKKNSEQTMIRGRLTPSFTSIEYGKPGYAQLYLATAEEIRTGAEDQSEMGVFSHLRQPQREANLRMALNEYLRFGMEAGIFYTT